MEFQGFKITPIGESKLSIDNGILRVSNISDSGLDGVLINTNGVKGYNIEYSEMSQMTEHNAILRSTSLMKNSFGEIITISDVCKRYDKNTNKILFGINASYLPEKFNILGNLDGKTIFDLEGSDLEGSDLEIIDTEDPQYVAIPWKLIWKLAKKAWGYFSAGYTLKDIYDSLRSKQTVTTSELVDNEGHLYGYNVNVTYDPIPFEIIVNQKPFTIEDLSVKYTLECPEYFKDKKAFRCSLIGEQITACNMPYFEITSINKL